MQNKQQESITEKELSGKDLENVVGGFRIFGININLNPTAPDPLPTSTTNTNSSKK